MIEKETIQLILYGTSVILPSVISILTIAKKASFNRKVEGIESKLTQFISSNDEAHKTLTQGISSCHIIMTEHTNNLHQLLRQKDVAARIRQIIKHAIQYCGNRNIGKVMDNSSEALIMFGIDVLDIGLQNITKQQLLAKFWTARDNSAIFAKQILGQQQWQKWQKIVTPILHSYIKNIFEIKDDVVNSKAQRFVIKLQDMTQTIVRQFIMFVAKQDYNDVGVGHNDQEIKKLVLEDINSTK